MYNLIIYESSMQQNIQKFINESIMSIFPLSAHDLETEGTKPLTPTDFQLSLPDHYQNEGLSPITSRKQTTNEDDENSKKYAQKQRKINTDRLCLHNSIEKKQISNISASNIGFKKDQLTFQMRLKIICFLKLLNKPDGQTLNLINSLPFQSALDLLFNKIRQFVYNLQSDIKIISEKLKTKQNQIKLLKTKQLKLEQQVFDESKKWNKSQAKYIKEYEQQEKCLMTIKRQAQELKENLKNAQQIIKEQNQKLQKKQNLDIMTIDAYIEIYKKQLNHKIIKVQKNSEQLVEEINKLHLQLKSQKKVINDLNEEINQILEQNKLYKCQSMFSKEKADKIQIKLEQSQDKLIAYYEMYNKEKQGKQVLIIKLKQLEKQSIRFVQQNKTLIKQLQEKEKEKNKLENEIMSIKKQKEMKKIENQKSEQNITKLNKDLQQVLDIYKAKTNQKKQDQLQKSYSNLSSSTSSMKLTKKKSQKHNQQICQMKLKIMIDEWKQKMEEIILFYEEKMQKLQGELLIKNELIAHLQKYRHDSKRSSISLSKIQN